MEQTKQISSLNKYEQYKPSGVEWLGDVPSHWELTRLGTRFEERKTKVSDKDYPPLSVTKNGILPQLDSAAKSNDGDNRKLVKAGDFVINSRSDRKGSSGISDRDGSVSLINIVIEPKNVYSIYCNYLLKSYIFVEEFYRMGHGIVADLWTTRYDEMKAITIGIPPIEEQIAIAQYLDRKTAQIDIAIAQKQKMIELLKERRQILIHKAVTQGLDPSVKMKNSGVEWIGHVPEHWEVVPIRRIIDVRDGTHDTPLYVEDNIDSYPLVTSKDFEGDIINFENIKKISKKDHLNISKRSGVKKGDVLMSMIGGNIGKSVIIDDNDNFSIKNVALFRTRDNISLAKYLRYYFESGLLQKQIDIKSRGGAQGFLSLSDIRNLVFFKIPQKEIELNSMHLDQIINQKLATAIRLKEQEIEKLKEYKGSLINSVVTGKVRVV